MLAVAPPAQDEFPHTWPAFAMGPKGRHYTKWSDSLAELCGEFMPQTMMLANGTDLASYPEWIAVLNRDYGAASVFGITVPQDLERASKAYYQYYIADKNMTDAWRNHADYDVLEELGGEVLKRWCAVKLVLAVMTNGSDVDSETTTEWFEAISFELEHVVDGYPDEDEDEEEDEEARNKRVKVSDDDEDEDEE